MISIAGTRPFNSWGGEDEVETGGRGGGGACKVRTP